MYLKRGWCEGKGEIKNIFRKGKRRWGRGCTKVRGKGKQKLKKKNNLIKNVLEKWVGEGKWKTC